jgi:hypothetical protein
MRSLRTFLSRLLGVFGGAREARDANQPDRHARAE